MASASLFDTAGPSSLSAASIWIESILTGGIVTSLCIIAVACLGISMLSGHISFRRGIQVVFGCFLLLGSPIIAQSVAAVSSNQNVAAADAPLPPIESKVIIPPPPANYDPYAGASLRRRR